MKLVVFPHGVSGASKTVPGGGTAQTLVLEEGMFAPTGEQFSVKNVKEAALPHAKGLIERDENGVWWVMAAATSVFL